MIFRFTNAGDIFIAALKSFAINIIQNLIRLKDDQQSQVVAKSNFSKFWLNKKKEKGIY